MSKRKLLINEVFRKAKEETGKTTKNGLATYLWAYFDERFPQSISDRTLSRYYDSFVEETRDEIGVEDFMLDRFSEYLGYKNFSDFSRTFIKKDEDTNKTTVNISVDKDEESITEKLSKIIINITNEQSFKMPEFMKQNGFGIVELVFVLLLITGTGKFVTSGGSENTNRLGIFGYPEVAKKKECMYWGGNEYKLAYCDDKNPAIDLEPIDTLLIKYFKKITRPDTLTIENALGKVWYDKSDNNVEFFTNHGKHPENGKALKDVTERILDNYAGIETE